MKKIIILLAFSLMLPNITFASQCSVKGQNDFTITFNVNGSDNFQALKLKQGNHGYFAWYTKEFQEDTRKWEYLFNDQVKNGENYELKITHSADSDKLDYFLRVQGAKHYQLIETIQKDLKPGDYRTLVKGRGISNIECSDKVDPVQPELPDEVCQYFPEPIQGWKGSESTLNVTNDSAQAIGWSDNYLNTPSNIYRYQENWNNGKSWDNVRVGFDKGVNPWPLYWNPETQVCDGFGCFPKDGLSGSGENEGNDGLTDTRKAQAPISFPESYGSFDLYVSSQRYGSGVSAQPKIKKICDDNPNICSFEFYAHNKAKIKVLSSLKSLTINQDGGTKFSELTVQVADKIQIEKLDITKGLHVVFETLDNSILTVDSWSEHTGDTKFLFGQNSRINIASSFVMSNQMDISNKNRVLLYGPDANVSFHTKTNEFYGFILAKTVSFNNPITVYGAVTSQNLTMKNRVVVDKPDYSCAPPPPVVQCKDLPLEEFKTSEIKNWSVMGYGASTKPSVDRYKGRFVLNANETKQATASAYNYTFPSDENYLEIEFDHYAYGGGYNGGDGMALVISDANVPPKTGAFGGPLGYGMKLYKNHYNEVDHDVEGFAGGWLAIGIDEYGNFNREGGESLWNRSLPNSVAVRGAGAQDESGRWLKGYSWIDAKQFNSAIDGRQFTPHRYKIVLDARKSGRINLSVSRRVGTSKSWETVIPKFDVLKKGNFNYTPENFRISVTASTGASKNTHEMDNFQVCADKYQKITQGIHHFEFDYTGTGSICQASKIELKACMDEACKDTYPSSIIANNPDADVKPVTVTLSPPSSSTHTWRDGDVVTFSDTKELYLQAHKSGHVKLGIAKSNIIQFGFQNAKCRVGGVLSEENCNLLFNGDALGVEIPNKVAGKAFFDENGSTNYQPERQPYLEYCGSAQQSNSDGEDRNIILSLEQVEPSERRVSVPAKVAFKDRNGVFSGEVSVAPGKAVTVENVYFNDKGQAEFNLKYPEVGKAVLRAQIQGETQSQGENSFVSFPAYLSLSSTEGDCASNSCSNGFVAAGDTFDMVVSAHQFDGSLAKNYQQDGLTISHSVTYPAVGGVSLGVLGVDKYNHTIPKDGDITSKVTIEQTVSEVGAFKFVVTPPELYLGADDFTIAPAQKILGRFYPKYFKVYQSKDADWAYPNGQTFTYMAQPFGVSKLFVEALNADKGKVVNYSFFDRELWALFNIVDLSSHKDRFEALKTYSGTWKNANGSALVESRSVGEYTGSAADGLIMTKGSNTNYPDGPFNLNELGQNTQLSIAGASSADPVLVLNRESTLKPQPDIRFGRVDLDDVGGNQGTTLRVPLRVEYWNGSRFIANPNDSQTDVKGVTAAETHIWPTGAGATPKAVTLGAGGEVASGTSRSVTATQAEPYRQQTRVWLDLDDSKNGLPWLKYNWDNDKVGEENPSSVVTFGIHRGNDRVIYRGEPGLTGQ
ncbi:TPA: DUF6701 domain-containing protein [Vibrio diabolicus]